MICHFNNFVLDDSLYRLNCDGATVDLEPLVFDLLLYLLRHRDRVVTRDELLTNLWPGKVVTDAALAVRIGELRKALGDSGKEQAFIKTVQGRGYQFIGEVTNETPAASITTESDSPRSPDRINKLEPQIAVLPFHSLGENSTDVLVAEGMTTEIISALVRIPDLTVVARGSSARFTDPDVDLREVGEALGVSKILKGSVQIHQDQLRINAQLIETPSGSLLWSETYDRDMQNLFDIQDDIAQQIATEMQVSLVTGQNSRRVAKSSNRLAAWKLVLEAGPLVESHVRENSIAAKRLLEQAIDLDPNYAAAHVLKGWLYWENAAWGWGEDRQDDIAQAKQEVTAAIKADPNYPDSYSLLGMIHRLDGDYETAVSMNRKALEMAPGDAGVIALYGAALVHAGRFAAGITETERALSLSPFPPPWMQYLFGMALHLDGRNEAACDYLEAAIERDPKSHMPRLWAVSAMQELGRVESTASHCNHIMELEPNFAVSEWVQLVAVSERARVRKNLIDAGLPP